MKLSGEELTERAENTIRACLENVPFIKIKQIERKPRSGDGGPDLQIKLIVSYGEQDLVAEVKGSGEPRRAREAVDQLLRYRYSAPPGTYGIFVAPFISEKTAEICAAENIGYVDLSGNARLCFGQVYIEKKGRPNIFAEKRDLRSLYSPKAERLLRVLLSNPKREWRIKDLADESRISLGWASKVKGILSDWEWINPEHGRIVLIAYKELLFDWAANYREKRNQARDFYSLKSVGEIEAVLAEVCLQKGVRYALTGFSGAARLAPAVRYQRAVAYVDAPQGDLASWFGLKEVSSGANVSLLSPYDEGVFYHMREFDGIWVASPVQIYLDLVGAKGRGEEAARAILEEVILPLW